MYLPREAENAVLTRLKKDRFVLVRGPRRAGKTTLLKYLQKTTGGSYVTFEDPVALEAFLRNPVAFVKEWEEPLYLDEIQYLGEKGAKALKLIYDETSARIVFSGSGAFDVKMGLLKYLVGRTAIIDLLPLSFHEFALWKGKEYNLIYKEGHQKLLKLFEGSSSLPEPSENLEKLFDEYCIWGGYPEIVLTRDKEKLAALVTTTIEEDIIKYFSLRQGKKLWNVIKRLAAITGNLLNYGSLDVSYQTAHEYISILERSFVVKMLSAFATNKLLELSKREKVYFYDTGFRNQLIGTFVGIKQRPDGGATLENAVLRQLHKYGEIRYWRTKSKAEVDFVIKMKDETPVPIEVKMKKKITPSLLSFIEKYKPEIALVATAELFEKRIRDTWVYGVPYYYF